MKLRNCMFSLVLMTSLLVGSVPVYAQDIAMETKTATGSAVSSFDVDTSIIGGGVIVSIPSQLDLEYDADLNQYVCKDIVSARGIIDAEESLVVTVNTEAIYNHTSKDDVYVVGTVDFGVDGTEIWTSDEMLASMDALDARDIVITVDVKDLEFVGSYTTEMFFDISIE